nr:hypothetical protein [Tanacetum cinerariifolium]
MGDDHLDTILETESDELIKSSVKNLVPILSESEGIPENMCDVPFYDNSPPLDISKDLFEDFSNSNDDSTSIDDDSFCIDDIEYVEASPPGSELISLEVMEIVIPEVGGIDKDILLTIKDDILREKLLNINLLNIEALKDNPTPSSDFMTKSSSTSLNFLLEETNTFDNSLAESETFYFDSKENSSGSTTTHADISLPDYEAFYDDHVKEISSGSTNTHCDFSLYDSFIFDLLINLFPPADRSDFYEFVDELAYIISPPEYDCFSFKNETNSGDFTMDVVMDIKEKDKIEAKTRQNQAGNKKRGKVNQVKVKVKVKPVKTGHRFEKSTKNQSRRRKYLIGSTRARVKGQVLSLTWETILEIEHAFEDKHLYINTPSWDHPTICYNDDDDEDCTIAITPILSTEEPDNSLSMGDEHLDTIPETKSDELIKSSVENPVPILSESEGIPDNICDVPFHGNSPPLDISKDQFEDFFDSNNDSTSIDDDSFSIDDIEYVEASPPAPMLINSEVMEIVIPKVGGIDEDILLTIKEDILHEKLLNINLLIANIEALKDNLTPSFDFMTKSSSTSLNFLLEETNTFDNYLSESESFCFDSEENSSGSTATRADISLPDYEDFYDDHVKEISSGSTTTHSDFSLYDSFIFDLFINIFSLADWSDFYEFVDELAHIISLPKYDCFPFKNEPNSGISLWMW